MAPILPAAITGLVLAGGRGRRMGAPTRPAALHGQAAGLAGAGTAPGQQVGLLCVNANRHLERYAAFGVPV